MKFSFDQSTDFSNKEFAWYTRDLMLPDFVKQAEADDSISLSELPKTAFADEMRQVYPINTPARTYVSTVFFNEKKAELKKSYGQGYIDLIEPKLKQAAVIFGIEKEVSEISEKLKLKEAEDYSQKYVSIVQFPKDDTEFAVYAYKTAHDLQLAGERFVQDLPKLPIEWRLKIASDYVQKAAEEGVDEFPDIIGKYAGLVLTTPEHMVGELKRRASYLKTAEFKKLYLEDLTKYASEVDDIDVALKIAEVCETAETREYFELKTKKAEGLGDPFEHFFTTSIEKMSSLIDVVEVAGEMYRIPELSKIGQDVYKQAFGVDINPSNREELTDFISTAPRSDMRLFKELSGIKPI